MNLEEEVQKRLQELPKKIVDTIEKTEWKNSVDNLGKKFKLDDEKISLLQNEVYYVLMGFEPRKDLKENITREVGVDSNIADWIIEDVNKNIFESIKGELESIQENTEDDEDTKFTPNSYEQILINQAKAMHPVGVAPSNLPTEEEGSGMETKREERVIHNSIGYSGADPYREPAE